MLANTSMNGGDQGHGVLAHARVADVYTGTFPGCQKAGRRRALKYDTIGSSLGQK